MGNRGIGLKHGTVGEVKGVSIIYECIVCVCSYLVESSPWHSRNINSVLGCLCSLRGGSWWMVKTQIDYLLFYHLPTSVDEHLYLTYLLLSVLKTADILHGLLENNKTFFVFFQCNLDSTLLYMFLISTEDNQHKAWCFSTDK